MITLRKVDLAIQGFALLLALFVAAASPGYLYYLEPLVGIWQIASALCNSFSMHHEGNSYRKRMIIYWSLSIPAVLLLFTWNDVIMVTVTTLSWGIALYYWIIYLLFIRHLSYRQELATVIRR